VDQYLEQTQVHERVRREAFDALGLDQEADSPARQVGQSLVVGDDSQPLVQWPTDHLNCHANDFNRSNGNAT